jgi:hypothetical protein
MSALIAVLCLVAGVTLANTFVLVRLARTPRIPVEPTPSQRARAAVALVVRERAIVEAARDVTSAARMLDLADSVEKGGAA